MIVLPLHFVCVKKIRIKSEYLSRTERRISFAKVFGSFGSFILLTLILFISNFLSIGLLGTFCALIKWQQRTKIP